MSNGGYTINRTEPVYICHVCSQCGNPVVMHSEVQIHVEDNRLLNDGGKLPDEAGKAAADAINKILDTYSRQTELPLTKAFEHASPCFNVSCEVRLINFSAQCPHCGRVEKWQGGPPDVSELPADASPLMFDTEEEANAWAMGKVLEKRKEIKESLTEDPEQSTAELNGTEDKLSECEAAIRYLSDLDNFVELTEIRNRKAGLKTQINNLGMFKNKEKKALNIELDAQTAQENEYLKSIKEERRRKGAEYSALSEKLEAALCRIGDTEICAESYTNRAKPLQVLYDSADAFTLTSKDYYRTAMKKCPQCGFHSPRIAFYCGSCGQKFE